MKLNFNFNFNFIFFDPLGRIERFGEEVPAGRGNVRRAVEHGVLDGNRLRAIGAPRSTRPV